MNHSRKWISGCLVLSLALVGCAKAQYTAGENPDPILEKGEDVVPARAECEVVYWDQSLDLNLWNYEFVSSNGGKFGFSNLGIIGLLDLSFKVDKATLQMKAYPATPYQLQKEVNVKSNDTDVQFGVNVGFSDIAVGFEHYSKTPVASLSKDALMKTLTVLKDNLSKQEWASRVLRAPVDVRDQVTIQAGSDAGITADDEFEVWDVKHHWDGSSCSSGYGGMEFLDSKPIAILQVRSIGRNLSVLKIKDQRISNVEIPVGSYVRQVPPAKGKKLKQLGRSIKLNSVVSGDLVLKNGSKIDLVKYVKMQFSDAVQDKKWKNFFYDYGQ